MYFFIITYYDKHLLEKGGGSAIAQFAYNATPMVAYILKFKSYNKHYIVSSVVSSDRSTCIF